jgi:hypothetical protein
MVVSFSDIDGENKKQGEDQRMLMVKPGPGYK